MVKNLPECGRPVFDPWVGKIPGERNSYPLAWRILWTEKPGRLQSVGSQRVGRRKSCSKLIVFFLEITLFFKFGFSFLIEAVE